MRILLIAEESAGLQCLRYLVKTKRELIGVVASPHSYDKRPSVWCTAQTMGLQVWPVDYVREHKFAQTLAKKNVDIILNIFSLHVICESVLASAKFGAFNLHPGHLPRYAGRNAPSWAVYNGEASHCVTLHKMTSGIDSGEIVFENPFDITEMDTGLTVMMKCIKLGIPLIVRLLETLEKDPASLPLTRQNLAQRRYFGREVPHDGRLCWNQPAEEIFRFVRACDYYPLTSPWGSPTTQLNGREIAILKAGLTSQRSKGPPGTVSSKEAAGVTVACADEDILIRLIRLDGEVMPAAEILDVGKRLTGVNPN